MASWIDPESVIADRPGDDALSTQEWFAENQRRMREAEALHQRQLRTDPEYARLQREAEELYQQWVREGRNNRQIEAWRMVVYGTTVSPFGIT